VDGVTEAAMLLLREYSWPGNIRELLNVVEYAFAVGEGNTLDPSELPPELRGEQLQSRRAGSAEDDERARIREALRESGGQRSHAAELLEISRSTLWRRMRELSLLDT
jgi:transcriptional regulator of acetoin/glycerol metabolism